MGKKKFATTSLNPEYETHVIYVVSFSSTSFVIFLSSTLLNVHPFQRLQIFDVIAKEASTKVLNKYVNFADVFFPDLASEPLKYTGINNHAIKLVDG